MTTLTGSGTGTTTVALGSVGTQDYRSNLSGKFNLTVSGFSSGTVTLERSFDSGSTYFPLSYIDGVAISWTAPLSTWIDEPESGVTYRARLVGVVGTALFRLSQ